MAGLFDQRDGGGDTARPDCAAGWRSPCRPRCRWSHWPGGWGRRRAAPPAPRLAVIGGAKIHRVFVQPVQQRLGGLGHAAFGVAHGGGVIAIDIAEIALPVHQRIADRELLGQPHQRVIDRLVAMGMEGAHHIAHNLGGFLEGGAGVEPEKPHAKQDAAMDRLQPVAHIGQRALGDGGQGIGEITLGQRLAERFGTDFVGDSNHDSAFR